MGLPARPLHGGCHNGDAEDPRVSVRGAKDRQGSRQEYTATLLDLVKAYPRTSFQTLWTILQKRGLGPAMMRNLQAMHDLTSYKVRLGEELSTSFSPKRWVREGCATSTVGFNCVHDEAMNQARQDREQAHPQQVGISWVRKPELRLRAPEHEKRRAKGTSTVFFTDLDFADDTKLLGRRKELQETGNAAVVTCLERFGENENKAKRESIPFGDPENGKMRVLGAFLDNDYDMKQRLSRAASAWAITHGRLCGSLLPLQEQVRVVKATVQSALLHSAQSRPFTCRDYMRTQTFMDKCWRYIAQTNFWSMERSGTNMQTIRVRLGVHQLRHSMCCGWARAALHESRCTAGPHVKTEWKHAARAASRMRGTWQDWWSAWRR